MAKAETMFTPRHAYGSYESDVLSSYTEVIYSLHGLHSSFHKRLFIYFRSTAVAIYSMG